MSATIRPARRLDVASLNALVTASARALSAAACPAGCSTPAGFVRMTRPGEEA
jgi:hypothetical protein